MSNEQREIMTEYQRLRLECALDALYLIGNELQHADSDCMEEAGNAIFLLHGIMRDCISDEEPSEGTESTGCEASRDWLRRIRIQKGLRQNAVAERAGISQAYYCQIEKGERGLNVSVAKRIANVLNFDWKIFFGK